MDEEMKEVEPFLVANEKKVSVGNEICLAHSLDSQTDVENTHNNNLQGTELDEKDVCINDPLLDQNAKENEEKASCNAVVQRDQERERLDKIVKGKRTQLCEPCLFDETEENAVAFCAVCIEYLCSDCVRGHKRSKMTRDHRVLNEHEMPKDSSIFKLMKSMMLCPDHSEVDVSYKCEQHEKFICTKCLAVNHRKCEEVQDISNGSVTANSKNAAMTLEDELKSVLDKTFSVRIEKEDNIKKLHVDQMEVLEEQSAFIQKLQEHVLSLGKKTEKETESIFEAEIAKLEKDIEECKKLERSETEYKELFDVAIKYGSIVEQSVVSTLIQKKVNLLREETEKYIRIPSARIVFRQNQELEVLPRIGEVFVARGEEKRDVHLENQTKQSMYEFSSDAFETEGIDGAGVFNARVREQTNNPLMQSAMSKSRTMHDLQQNATESICSVTKVLSLQGGHFLVTDFNNRDIKVLNADFSVQSIHKVKGKPIDLCQTSDNQLAVIYDGMKIIERLQVLGDLITVCGQFTTKLFPISIDSSSEHRNEVVILFSDEEKSTPKTSDFDVIEVQIRLLHNGQVVKEFSSFKNESSSKLTLENTGRIRVIPKQLNTFLISECNKLHCFEPDNGLKEKWFYKSYRDNIINDISDIAIDREGNFYVCGKGSKNIHQISGDNFMKNRVIATVPGNPLSVCVDDDRRLLIIGCENDNFIYVASFT